MTNVFLITLDFSGKGISRKVGCISLKSYTLSHTQFIHLPSVLVFSVFTHRQRELKSFKFHIFLLSVFLSLYEQYQFI